MKQCWFSQVLALSAIYTVLTQSEQLLTDEGEGNSLHLVEADSVFQKSDVTLLNYASAVAADFHVPAANSEELLKSQEGANQLTYDTQRDSSIFPQSGSVISLSDLLEILNESFSKGLVSQPTREEGDDDTGLNFFKAGSASYDRNFDVIQESADYKAESSDEVEFWQWFSDP